MSNVTSVVFPWDRITEYRNVAKNYADTTGNRVIDLSVGSPKDLPPQSVQDALVTAGNVPGYPLTSGTNDLLNTIRQWLTENLGATGLTNQNVLPTIGSKEIIGLLPQMLGLGSDDIIVRPKVAYPTYDIGALACGAKVLATDNIADWENNSQVKLIWINYPRNPTGECASADYLRNIIVAARKIGAIVASDECYAGFDWQSLNENSDKIPWHTSILNNAVTNGDYTNVLMFYSLSKQYNMASYRSSFIAGDSKIVQNLLAIRKQLGLIVPYPVQCATITALRDDDFALAQSLKYHERYKILRAGLESAGYETLHSTGGLYIWVKAKTGNCWTDLAELAKISIIVSPGEFYSTDLDGTGYLRFALTAIDDDIKTVAERLTAQ